jgi:hypothetical protein
VTLRLQALGRRRALLSQGGARVELTSRHSEILTLLALHPEGLASDELALQLYGSSTQGATVRAEVSRLRRLLACRLLRNPYRLEAEVQADFLEVTRRLEAGDAAGAARHHGGPLLARSRVPRIVREREHIERRLRQAELARFPVSPPRPDRPLAARTG